MTHRPRTWQHPPRPRYRRPVPWGLIAGWTFNAALVAAIVYIVTRLPAALADAMIVSQTPRGW
jgi:hypothetical protein